MRPNPHRRLRAQPFDHGHDLAVALHGVDLQQRFVVRDPVSEASDLPPQPEKALTAFALGQKRKRGSQMSASDWRIVTGLQHANPKPE